MSHEKSVMYLGQIGFPGPFVVHPPRELELVYFLFYCADCKGGRGLVGWLVEVDLYVQ